MTTDDEYVTVLEAEVAKTQTGRCPNCDAVLRPLHCCMCEGCDGCKNQPAVGVLLDAWELLPNDVKSDLGRDFPPFVKAITNLMRTANE